MDKILVTTDLSVSSRAAIRFAIRFAEERKAQLEFLHVHHVPADPDLHKNTYDREYDKSVAGVQLKLREQLNRFVRSVYRSMGITAPHNTVVVNKEEVEDTIIRYAFAHCCNCIIMSTRGNGMSRGAVGSIAGKVLDMSKIPVVLVAPNHRLM